MGPGKRAIFEGYGAVSDAWIERGEAISSSVLFAPVIDLLPSEPIRAIDIGAGSGRDSAWLAGLGHRVVAVEPVDRLRHAGMSRHRAETIDWRSGALPELGAIAERNAFDLVLVIGVWQHLEAPDQALAMRRLGEIAAPGALVVMALRHGPGAPARPVYPIDIDATLANASAAGFRLERRRRAESMQEANRAAGVEWTWLALRRE